MATKKIEPQPKNKLSDSSGNHSCPNCDATDVLKVRIDAAAQAQKRSRAAFLASTIMSVAILIAMWNAYWSWYRSFLFKGSSNAVNVTQEAPRNTTQEGQRTNTTPETSRADKTPEPRVNAAASPTANTTPETPKANATPETQSASITQLAQRTLIDEWIRSREIIMPILGIKAGVGDAAVVGSLSLYIICIWVLLSMRRENHIIGILLNDTSSCPESTKNIVFHGIVGFSVFTTVSNFDAPIRKLNQQPTESRFPWLTRWTYKVLILLPAITIVLIIVMDIVSIFFMNAPFREGNQPLSVTLSHDDWIKRAIMDSVCLLLLIPITTLCVRTIGYNDGTQSVLQEYDRLLKPEPK